MVQLISYAVKRPTFLRFGRFNSQYLSQVLYKDSDAIRLLATAKELVQRIFSPWIDLNQLEIAFKTNDEAKFASVLGYTSAEVQQKASIIKSAANSLRAKYPIIVNMSRSTTLLHSDKISYLINFLRKRRSNYSMGWSSNFGNQILGGDVWCQEPQLMLCAAACTLFIETLLPAVICYAICVETYCDDFGPGGPDVIANNYIFNITQ